MPANTAYTLHKKKYTQISVKKRKLLVQLVVQQGKTLSEAGRKLHINPSTVRLIIKKYQQTGTYFMKKLRNTPKQPRLAQRSLQVERKEVKTPKEVEQNNSKLQLNEKQTPKFDVNIKVEETRPSSLEWYYPFMHYGFQY